jgi:hypothetical protein
LFIAAIVGVLIVCCVIVAIAVLVLRRRRRPSRQMEEVNLKIKAEGFQQLSNIVIGDKLGGGAFGEVYYGTLNGETPVALKKLKSNEHFEAFLAEAMTLKDLNQ